MYQTSFTQNLHHRSIVRQLIESYGGGTELGDHFLELPTRMNVVWLVGAAAVPAANCNADVPAANCKLSIFGHFISEMQE